MNNLYRIGEIINPIILSRTPIIPSASMKCFVSVPSRIDTFLCNHHFFVNPPRPQIYPVNSVNFVIDERVESEVSIFPGGESIEIDSEPTYKPIILHTVLILKKIFKIKNINFYIKARNIHGIRHGGLGSSAAVQTSTAIAINKIFGDPIDSNKLVKFLAQNYGEDSEEEGYLSPMASIGGAAASAIYKTNLIIMGGEAEVWSDTRIPDHSVFLLRPKNIKNPSGQEDMEMYKRGDKAFIEMGEKYGSFKESILKNKIITGLEHGNLTPLIYHINLYTAGVYGDIPSYFANRWISHGLFFDQMLRDLHCLIFEKFKLSEVCIFVSSGGPTISVITRLGDEVLLVLENLEDFDIIKTELTSDGSIINLIKN